MIQRHSRSLRIRITSTHAFVSDSVGRRIKPAYAIRLRQWCHEWEVALEVVESEQTTHDSLVVAKHQEGEAGTPCDGRVEAFAGEETDTGDGPFWEVAKFGEDAYDAGWSGGILLLPVVQWWIDCFDLVVSRVW